ncbi:MAG: hypothetical protein V1837_00700 [Candidatus Woesearchaeota archaeon]
MTKINHFYSKGVPFRMFTFDRDFGANDLKQVAKFDPKQVFVGGNLLLGNCVYEQPLSVDNFWFAKNIILSNSTWLRGLRISKTRIEGDLVASRLKAEYSDVGLEGLLIDGSARITDTTAETLNMNGTTILQYLDLGNCNIKEVCNNNMSVGCFISYRGVFAEGIYARRVTQLVLSDRALPVQMKEKYRQLGMDAEEHKKGLLIDFTDTTAGEVDLTRTEARINLTGSRINRLVVNDSKISECLGYEDAKIASLETNEGTKLPEGFRKALGLQKSYYERARISLRRSFV